MKKLLITFLTLFLLFLSPALIQAVPSPQQVKDAQTNADVVVIGKVQERKINGGVGTFKLLVSKVERSNGEVKIGDLLTIDFRHIPYGLEETGSSAVKVVNGDEIRIWLDLQENGNFRSSIAGDTIEYININETNHTILSLKERIEYYFQSGQVLIFFILCLGISLIIYLINKFTKYKKK